MVLVTDVFSYCELVVAVTVKAVTALGLDQASFVEELNTVFAQFNNNNTVCKWISPALTSTSSPIKKMHT